MGDELGGYCDIPYQYLVGYDGSLWEARPINMYSDALAVGTTMETSLSLLLAAMINPLAVSTSTIP